MIRPGTLYFGNVQLHFEYTFIYVLWAITVYNNIYNVDFSNFLGDGRGLKSPAISSIKRFNIVHEWQFFLKSKITLTFTPQYVIDLRSVCMWCCFVFLYSLLLLSSLFCAQFHRHCRSCLQYINTKSRNIFKVKLQGSKVKRISNLRTLGRV